MKITKPEAGCAFILQMLAARHLIVYMIRKCTWTTATLLQNKDSDDDECTLKDNSIRSKF